jgi:hypothetical protein
MFQVVPVNSSKAEALEPLGTKRKFWFRDDHNRRMLFKAEERGTGEDWAEKIACELCALVGLPHVQYELALESDGQKPGVVCENCAPPPVALVLGNQLLFAVDPEYPAGTPRKYKVRQHTVEAVAEVLSLLQPPPEQWMRGVPAGVDSALGVFAGYVMLDAWIANQDRHHENWGVLFDQTRPTGSQLALAPTFDHGASMARNLTDSERQERLVTKDVNRQIPAFSRRARSAFYGESTPEKPMTTVEAWYALAGRAPEAAKVWLGRLAAIGPDSLRQLLEEVPPNRLSRIGRDFTLYLLLENQKRLLAGDQT